MKKDKLILGIVILAIIVIIIISFVPKQASDTIKVGFVGSLTGDSAIIGEENLNGIQLAAQKFENIKLVVKNDEMDERETFTQYRQMVNVEGVNYILTTTYGGYLALASTVEEDDVILINSLDSSEELAGLGENAFAIGIYDESIGYAIGEYLNEMDVNETGLIVNLEDPFMVLTRDAVEEKYAGETDQENYDFDTKDFRTILMKLSKYDYLVLLGWEETGLIVKQAQELAIESQIIGIDTFASEDFRRNTNNQYEGLIFTFWEGSEDNEHYENMLSSYSSTYNKDPENVLFAAAGYDAMSVLGDILQICGDEVTCVKERLRNVKGVRGATGILTIDPDGITRSIEETIYTYQNGEIVKV